MIHAPQPGQNVTTVDIKYFYPSFARRILPNAPVRQKNCTGFTKRFMGEYFVIQRSCAKQ